MKGYFENSKMASPFKSVWNDTTMKQDSSSTVESKSWFVRDFVESIKIMDDQTKNGLKNWLIENKCLTRAAFLGMSIDLVYLIPNLSQEDRSQFIAAINVLAAGNTCVWMDICVCINCFLQENSTV